MQTYVKSFLTVALVSATAVAGSAYAADVMGTKTIGAYRVELHVLQAEPFFSKEDVAVKHIKEGMEVQGGATPVMQDAASRPNHHLVVHIFGKKTRQAITDATIAMRYVPLDRKGIPTGAPVEVPVVVMQAIGKGPSSTHYGNNVTMPAGRCQVTVIVNGETAVFGITASDASSTPMRHMKM